MNTFCKTMKQFMPSYLRLLILFFFFSASSSTFLVSQDKDLALNFFLQEKGYQGVILLYDYEKDKLITSDNNKTDELVLPASTFKILNTLLFLEIGIAKDTSYTLPWNGKEYKHKGRKIAVWNKDTNLAEAFRNSTVWYYKKLSGLIDFQTYKYTMKKLKYGKVFGRNKDGLDFWNIGKKIGISARDQINFLVKIYDNDEYFKQANLDIIKELMIEEVTEEYTLRSKTGWTVCPDGRLKKGVDLGWYIGYVEFKDNAYFFAVRLEKPSDQTDKDFANDRKVIAKKALLQKFKIDVR